MPEMSRVDSKLTVLPAGARKDLVERLRFRVVERLRAARRGLKIAAVVAFGVGAVLWIVAGSSIYIMAIAAVDGTILGYDGNFQLHHRTGRNDHG
jgi:hypothetical protein